MKIFFLLIYLLSIYFYSSDIVADNADANKLLKQSYILLKDNRHKAARKNIDNAIEIFRNGNDIEGLFYAYSVSSDYYDFMKKESHRNSKLTKQKYNKKNLKFDKIITGMYLGDNEQLQSITYVSDLIDKLIGDAKCETNSQCTSIPVGHRACGGPSSYIVYSTLNTNKNKLMKLSEIHMELSRKFTRGFSICIYESPPIVVCNNKCLQE